jgi:hypothetical protein
MNKLLITDTDDEITLGIYELSDDHIYWCLAGGLSTAKPEDEGYEGIRDIVEGYKAGNLTLELGQCSCKCDDDSPFAVQVPLRVAETGEVMVLGAQSIATSVLRGLAAPSWNQWDMIIGKGNDFFGEGNWTLDWHIAAPRVDVDAVLSFILRARRKCP